MRRLLREHDSVQHVHNASIRRWVRQTEDVVKQLKEALQKFGFVIKEKNSRKLTEMQEMQGKMLKQTDMSLKGSRNWKFRKADRFKE